MKRRVIATSAMLLASTLLSGCAEGNKPAETTELSGIVSLSDTRQTTVSTVDPQSTFRTTTHTTVPTEFFTARSDVDPLWGGDIQTVTTTAPVTTKKTTVSTTEEILMVIGDDEEETTTTADTTKPVEVTEVVETITEPVAASGVVDTGDIDIVAVTAETHIYGPNPAYTMNLPEEYPKLEDLPIVDISKISTESSDYTVYNMHAFDIANDLSVSMSDVTISSAYPGLGYNGFIRTVYEGRLFYSGDTCLFEFTNATDARLCAVRLSDDTLIVVLWDAASSDYGIVLPGTFASYTTDIAVYDPEADVYGPAMPSGVDD